MKRNLKNKILSEEEEIIEEEEVIEVEEAVEVEELMLKIQI